MKFVAIAMVFSLPLLAGCQQDVGEVRTPAAATLTEDAMGHFCEMQVVAHEGPKAQIHLSGVEDPLWFTQVRDGIAYFKSPEKPAEIMSFYVNDMATAENWAEPGVNNWIAAQKAYFVIGSDARGGMGAPEFVPFSSRPLAEKFAAERGGKIMLLPEIPAAMALSPVDIEGSSMDGMNMKQSTKPK